jgi:RNA polymerase subunit RPABC4/transcription elongation factor Spt4/PBP1b-binding outer membrane lipoprotein LpoB
VVFELLPRSSPRVARAMVVALVAVALLTVPALAGDGDETRSTVDYGPDLAVSAGDVTLSKAVLMAGVDFNVTIKVYNLGDEDALAVTVDLLVDTEPVDQVVLEQVLVDGWATASFDLSLNQGDHTIGILVDGDDAIDEKREDNNDANLDVRVRSLPDAAVGPGDLSVSKTHPMEGDVLVIEALIHNLGESAATLVVVQFWDGDPVNGQLIANKTVSVPEAGEKLVTTEWDTTGLGGTHAVNVLIARVMPGEEELHNNMASITVLIFTKWDLVLDSVSGDKVIEQEYTQDGFVTVREGATLTVSHTDFMFLQDYQNQFALFVEDGGSLVLDDAIVWSEQPLLVIMGNGTSLRMSSLSQLWATIVLQGDVTVSIEDSLVDGGMMGSAIQVTLLGSEVTGPVDLNGGLLTVEDSLLSSPDTTVLTALYGMMVDTAFVGPAQVSMSLWAGANVELRNVTCQAIDTDATSTAIVYRRVEVLVEDESTLVVPEASIQIEHYINGTVVGTATGGEDGTALVEVISDIIRDGESHFIGNYLVRSTFTDKEGTEPLLLTPFPTMDEVANLPTVTVVLPPVDPRDLIASTPGDMVVETGEEMALSADFIQDGNIVVRGTLTVATSTLSILQDRDHQYYVLVESSGKLELHGATITSDLPINIYLSDNASLVLGPGSALDVNALVTEDDATVEARASTLEARLLVRGGQFVLESECSVVADKMVVDTPKVDIRGGEIVVEELMISAPATAIEGVDVTAQSVELISSFANVTDSSFVMDTITVEANILTVTGSVIDAEEPLDLAVATLYMDTTSSDQPLASSRTDSKVYLYDAEVPYPFSLGNATVLVYWYLTVEVQDLLSNPVPSVDVEVYFTNNGTAVTNGVTNDDGNVRFPLLGSIVTPEGEYFVGNYKIVAYNPKDAGEIEIRYVNLDKAKKMISAFDEPLVPPTMIGVDISVVNTTVVAGTQFVVSGVATAIFPTVRSPLYSGDVEVRLWDNGSTWTNMTTLDENGAFQVTIPVPLVDGVYYVKAAVVPTGEFEGVPGSDSKTITMDVVPPGPTSLVIVLETTRIDEFPAGGLLTVRGTVKYNTAQGAPASNVRVFMDDPISHQKYQATADGLGAFQFPPRVGPAFYGQYDYLLTARDDDLGIETTTPAKLTVIAVEVEEEQEQNNDWLLWTLIIVVVAIAAIGGTLGYWAFSSKGRMVECGECGTLVPDTATQCPKCGIEFEVEVAKCSECESWIRSDATTCPYCGTPFRDMEGLEEGAPVPEAEDAAGEGDVVAELDEEGASAEKTAGEGVVVDEDALKASPEAATESPEALKKEIRPRPVVQRKAYKPRDEAGDEGDSLNGEANGSVVKPRVVRKVATPPSDDEDASSFHALDDGFDLEEEKEEG